jgi:AAA15 family ATPase/GTPase
MILSLEITNFMSFKDKVTFSFEALPRSKKKNDKLVEDRNVVEMPDGTRINKLAIIYGANASGKSNLLKAFQFLGMF